MPSVDEDEVVTNTVIVCVDSFVTVTAPGAELGVGVASTAAGAVKVQ